MILTILFATFAIFAHVALLLRSVLRTSKPRMGGELKRVALNQPSILAGVLELSGENYGYILIHKASELQPATRILRHDPHRYCKERRFARFPGARLPQYHEMSNSTMARTVTHH